MTAIQMAARNTGGLFHGWIIAAVAFLAMALVFGARFSLGLFLPFLPDALNATQASVSFALALSMVSAGVAQPLVGLLADRWGPKSVLLLGLASGGVAFVGTASATALWHLAAFMGIAGGISFASISPVIATALMSRWFRRYRGRAMGFATSGTKVSMILLLPATAAAIAILGWRPALLILGVSIWALIPFAWVLVRSTPQEMGLLPDGDAAEDGADDPEVLAVPTNDGAALIKPPGSERGVPLRQAFGTAAFWLIAISLFGNGFMMNLVFLHLPSYILQQGYGQTLAASGLAALGAVGIAGNILTGTLSDRIGRKLVLVVLYGARGLTTLLVVIAPSPTTLVTFTVVFGLLGYGAIGVVGAMTADIFGRRSIGAILGIAYVLNQIGGACGIYAGGLSYEMTGAYEPALSIAAATSFLSLICIWWVPMRAITPRAQPAT